KLRAPKGEAAATLDDFRQYAPGLVCMAGHEHDLRALTDIFGAKSVYVELQRHLVRDQEQANQARIEMARRMKLPLVATNGVRFARREERELYDAMTCIHHKTTIASAGRLL